jgi:dihydrofolate synthase/folylpolyglutamate synthase
MLAELLPRSPAIILTRACHPRAVDAHELARLAEELGGSAIAIEKVADALACARNRASEFDVTVVTGSLFVVAEARALVLRARGEALASDD